MNIEVRDTVLTWGLGAQTGLSDPDPALQHLHRAVLGLAFLQAFLVALFRLLSARCVGVERGS